MPPHVYYLLVVVFIADALMGDGNVAGAMLALALLWGGLSRRSLGGKGEARKVGAGLRGEVLAEGPGGDASMRADAWSGADAENGRR